MKEILHVELELQLWLQELTPSRVQYKLLDDLIQKYQRYLIGADIILICVWITGPGLQCLHCGWRLVDSSIPNSKQMMSGSQC